MFYPHTRQAPQTLLQLQDNPINQQQYNDQEGEMGRLFKTYQLMME
jgi:hypothetical protein